LLAGADIAATLKLKEGDSIEVLGSRFYVEAVLPMAGTVDDSRLFAHLHTVQRLTGKNSLLNAIEIVGCCSAISNGLIQKINKLLPDAKVVTIRQIVQTQLNTTVLMKKLSLIMFVIIILVGGASIANYMFANVHERRREIGILMAMGATPGFIVRMFLLKALLIGIAGGIIGYILGTMMAAILGPQLAGVPVRPIPTLAAYGVALSTLISLLASVIPAIKATRVDPSIIMQEE
jgi:putative ABC transport system permease protein